MDGRDNLAYVGSTLPVSILDQRLREWGVTRILVASIHLEKSYRYLQRNHPKIEISVVPRQPVKQLVILTYHLLCARVFSRRVYFFHECCCLIFDLLIRLVRPNAVFMPIVTLDSFKRLEFRDIPIMPSKCILFFFGLVNKFTPYLRDGDNESVGEVVWACSAYPSTVERLPRPAFTGMFVPKASTDTPRKISILLLLGSDVISSSVLIRFFDRLLLCLDKNHYCVYGKDHPNPGSRLHYTHPSILEIDPHCPIELIREDFDFVLGVASTALLNFPGRAISIVGLLDKDRLEAVDRRLKPLNRMVDNGSLFVPNSFDQLLQHIKSRK